MYSQLTQVENGEGMKCLLCPAEGQNIKRKSVTACGHTYCYPCIYGTVEFKEVKKCPNCEQFPFPLTMSFKDRTITELKWMATDGHCTAFIIANGWGISEIMTQQVDYHSFSGLGTIAAGVIGMAFIRRSQFT